MPLISADNQRCGLSTSWASKWSPSATALRNYVFYARLYISLRFLQIRVCPESRIIKREPGVLPASKYTQQFPKAPAALPPAVAHTQDRMFLSFLRFAKSAQTFNHLVEDTADILVSAANVLVTVGPDEARKMVEKIEDHFRRSEKAQKDRVARMSESSMLRVISDHLSRPFCKLNY